MKKVKLTNILSFKEAEFENFNQLNILIGINNSGKSNLFRFLNTFKINKELPKSFFFENSKFETAKIEFEFELSPNLLTNIFKTIFENRLENDVPPFALSDNKKLEYAEFNELFSNFQFKFDFDKKGVSFLTFFAPSNLRNKINYVKTESLFDQNWHQKIHDQKRYFDVLALSNIGINHKTIKRKEDFNDYNSTHSNSLCLLVLSEIFKFFDSIQYIHDDRGFSFEKDIEVIQQKITSKGDNFPQKLFQFYNIRSKQKYLPILDSLLKRFYPSIEEIGQELQYSDQNSNYQIVPFIHEENSTDQRKFDQIGRGIHHLVIIITHLIEFEENSVLLIEEPETNLHPKMQKILFEIFQEFGTKKQIFISTHSPFLYSNIESNCNLFHIKKTCNESKVKQITQNDLVELNTELGVSLSDLLIHDKLIFVEGISDELTLKIWMKKLGFDPNQNHIGFIVMNGIKNFTYYSTGATLDFLQKHDVKVWFILDRDEQKENDIKKLEERFKSLSNSKLIVLQKRELENYVLNIKLLSKYLNKRANEEHKQLEVSIFDEKNIMKSILDGCVSLKQFLIDKKMIQELKTALHFDQKNIFERNSELDSKTRIIAEYDRLIEIAKTEKEKINHISQEIKQQVEKIFENASCPVEKFDYNNELLKIIPGSKILEYLLKQNEMNYDKNRDLQKIAELIEKSAIDGEILKIFQQIMNIPT